MSQINSMPTSVSWSYNTTNNVNADVAYDQFTAADRNHVTYSGDYELMVWLAKLGNIQPIGSVVRSGISLAGHTWDLWSGGGSQHTYSFVATSTTNSFSGDLMVFWKYLQQNYGYPMSSQYVLSMLSFPQIPSCWFIAHYAQQTTNSVPRLSLAARPTSKSTTGQPPSTRST
jgi:xyloglucan-specific endo-beta-1,4-glucanase